MRVGFNPNKDKIQEPNEFFHQVSVSIYIPNQEAYFKDSFVILKYCLKSLFKTYFCWIFKSNNYKMMKDIVLLTK